MWIGEFEMCKIGGNVIHPIWYRSRSNPQLV
jgi:hypothetical protein